MNRTYAIYFRSQLLGRAGLRKDKPFYESVQENLPTPQRMVENLAEDFGKEVKEVLSHLNYFISPSHQVFVVREE